jgi:hypothetical protein
MMLQIDLGCGSVLSFLLNNGQQNPGGGGGGGGDGGSPGTPTPEPKPKPKPPVVPKPKPPVLPVPQIVDLDESCSGIALAAEQNVQRRALGLFPQALQNNEEVGFYAIRNFFLPGYSMTPSFTSHERRRIDSSVLLNELPPSVRDFGRESILVHTHQNDVPPSPAGKIDQGGANFLGFPIAAIDRAGTMTCVRPQSPPK